MTDRHPEIHLETQFTDGFSGFVYDLRAGRLQQVAAFSLGYDSHKHRPSARVYAAIRRASGLILCDEDNVISGALRAYDLLCNTDGQPAIEGVTGLGIIAINNSDVLVIARGSVRKTVAHSVICCDEPSGLAYQTEFDANTYYINAAEVLPGHHVGVSLRPSIPYNAACAPCVGPGITATIVLPR